MNQLASLVLAFCRQTGWKPFGRIVTNVHITNELVVFCHDEGGTYAYNVWRLLFDNQIGFSKALGVQGRIGELFINGANLDMIINDIIHATTSSPNM